MPKNLSRKLVLRQPALNSTIYTRISQAKLIKYTKAGLSSFQANYTNTFKGYDVTQRAWGSHMTAEQFAESFQTAHRYEPKQAYPTLKRSESAQGWISSRAPNYLAKQQKTASDTSLNTPHDVTKMQILKMPTRDDHPGLALHAQSTDGTSKSEEKFYWTPAYLMRSVLLGGSNVQYWREIVSKSRSLRLPVVLLQMFIRKTAYDLPERDRLRQLLPNDQEWGKVLSSMSQAGHTSQALDYYSYILEGRTADEQCKRLLERKTKVPLFLFTFILGKSSQLSSVDCLNALIEASHFYIDKESNLSARDEFPISKSVPVKSLCEIRDRFSCVMRVLTFHCLRLEPRLIVKIASVAAQYVERIEMLADQSRKHYLIQCELFNRALRMLRPQARLQPVQQAYPDAYFWEAQRIMLSVTEGQKKPLLVDLRGFQTIREVLAGQAMNRSEAQRARRYGASWPPYPRPTHGMDEEISPEDNWSRTVSAGMVMQEAGYAKDERDDALDILQGMTMDGSPTIHQRTSSIGAMGVWEASIKATRNNQEAWSRFLDPPIAGSQPGLAQYAAMFEKLVLREVGFDDDTLPGEKALNFAVHQTPSLTEMGRARLAPPNVAELYTNMLLAKVRPQGRCLRILVANAESLETAHRYLRDSTEKTDIVQALTAAEPIPKQLDAVPLELFAAYIQMCARLDCKRGEQPLKRALRLAGMRLETERSRWAPFIWGLVLKSLSQHHESLKMSVSSQLHLTLGIVKRIEASHGPSLSSFIQFAKNIQKIMRRLVPHLLADLDSGGESARQNPWRVLYERSSPKQTFSRCCDVLAETDSRQTALGDQETVPLFLDVVHHMEAMFKRLVAQERACQAALGDMGPAPLERMACRRDPVNSTHAHEYMLALAFAGEFEEMVQTLHWLMEEWSQLDVIEAMNQLDEPAPHGNFLEVLCAMQALAGPILGEAKMESLRQKASAIDWLWPDNDAVTAYEQIHHHSVAPLRRVLEHTPRQYCDREKA